MPGFDYRGQYAYHLTLVSESRSHRFEVAAAAQACVDLLHRAAAHCRSAVLAYSVMPDHVHLLVQGEAEDSDLRSFVKLFKQLTGYHLKTTPRAPVWQRSYHDRVLWDEAEINEVVAYIVRNAATEGLTAAYERHRWTGGVYVEAVLSGSTFVAFKTPT